MSDPTGKVAITTCILIGSVVVGTLAFGHTAAASHKYTGKVDWGGVFLNGLGWGLSAYTLGMSAYGAYVGYCGYRGYTPKTSIGETPKTIYPPNNGFNAEPRNSILQPGSRLERTGLTKHGKFVAPRNTPQEKLALPPDKIGQIPIQLEVLKPLKAQLGTAMPWFG